MLDAGFLTLAQLKEAVLPEELREEGAYDKRLQRLGKGVAAQLNRHCNRVFQRGVAVQHSVTADRTSISLPCYPVEVVARVDMICGGGESEVTDRIMTLGTAAGIVEFGRVLGSYRDRVVVTYNGGYWLDDGGAMPEGATPMEWDVLHAYEVQCQAVIEHTNILGTAAARTDKEGRGGPKLRELAMLDVVEKILRPYRRFA